ncbi:MAG TPA: hypothetical protein VGX24_17705 [Pyrinomonadaceae bacterium]|jgi:DNA-binding NarL/FixJ family response regulator|nr:hypothetical protein [Pyrinomonadaceae bacterium]
MTIKIVCFDDNPSDIKNLKASFTEKKHKINFRSYDLRESWNEQSDRAKEIAEFNPDLAIVDLADQSGTGEANAGFRIIRKLKELQDQPELNMNKFPVVAWSKLLKTDTERGQALRQRVENFRAIPIFKPRREKFNVAEILRKSGLSQ